MTSLNSFFFYCRFLPCWWLSPSLKPCHNMAAMVATEIKDSAGSDNKDSEDKASEDKASVIN